MNRSYIYENSLLETEPDFGKSKIFVQDSVKDKEINQTICGILWCHKGHKAIDPGHESLPLKSNGLQSAWMDSRWITIEYLLRSIERHLLYIRLVRVAFASIQVSVLDIRPKVERSTCETNGTY